MGWFGWLRKKRQDKVSREKYSIEDLAKELKQSYKRVHYAIGKLGIKSPYKFDGRKKYSKSAFLKLSRYFRTAKPHKHRKPRQQKQSREEMPTQNTSLYGFDSALGL